MQSPSPRRTLWRHSCQPCKCSVRVIREQRGPDRAWPTSRRALQRGGATTNPGSGLLSVISLPARLTCRETSGLMILAGIKYICSYPHNVFYILGYCFPIFKPEPACVCVYMCVGRLGDRLLQTLPPYNQHIPCRSSNRRVERLLIRGLKTLDPALPSRSAGRTLCLPVRSAVA